MLAGWLLVHGGLSSQPLAPPAGSPSVYSPVYIYIYAFSRCFYPKHSGCIQVIPSRCPDYIWYKQFSNDVNIPFRCNGRCVPGVLFTLVCVFPGNPQPFALLPQCSTTEPHRNTPSITPEWNIYIVRELFVPDVVRT